MNKITVSTPTRNVMMNITDDVRSTVKNMDIKDGVITIYCPHTTAGICINESDDPAVQRDIMKRLNDLVPLDLVYDHAEGNSDAHIKSTVVGSSVQVFVEKGELQLGQWQTIYFCEFDGPREREIWVK
ncbi:secondary thiamine-phosphate synthase enzyme YjbQ [Patescibacteria group bacterium]|nr:secondary thiamine-phosphate synthase enzyme YjbQ [Patescibacteria group bacterium]MBU1682432.1 secondary thiamine-phosphate synthase enzyme YjbQ [Patescibacteria group bacterium]MBU1934715.1 secondary thiamine-phosphate synthase enzyme YjbQ [Patescibacteria group bacterium]